MSRIRAWMIIVVGLGACAAIPIAAVVVARTTPSKYPRLALRLGLLVPEEGREEACNELGRLAQRSDMPLLIAHLRDPAWRVDMAAADALTQIADPSAVPTLVALAADARDETREYAVVALGAVRDPRATAALCRALRDANARVGRNAGYALQKLADPSAADDLLDRIADRAFLYRGSAAHALAAIRDPRAFAAIAALLRDGADGSDRGGAAAALGELGDRRAVPLLVQATGDQNEYVGAPAVEALGRLRDPLATPALCRLLATGSGRMRPLAAEALGVIGDTSAVEGLRATPITDAWTRIAVISARGLLHDATVLPSLRAEIAVQDGSVLVRLLPALAACGDASDWSTIVAHLCDDDREVAAAAREAQATLSRRLAAPPAPAVP